MTVSEFLTELLDANSFLAPMLLGVCRFRSLRGNLFQAGRLTLQELLGKILQHLHGVSLAVVFELAQ